MNDSSQEGGQGHPIYKWLLEHRLELHLAKSGSYGNDEDPMANFTAIAQLSGEPRYLYPVYRSIEKLTRVLSLHAQGRSSEIPEEFGDIASLMDCAHAMLLEDAGEWIMEETTHSGEWIMDDTTHSTRRPSPLDNPL